eukprot:1752299-Pleurochrysis_carterae.AAC.1
MERDAKRATALRCAMDRGENGNRGGCGKKQRGEGGGGRGCRRRKGNRKAEWRGADRVGGAGRENR